MAAQLQSPKSGEVAAPASTVESRMAPAAADIEAGASAASSSGTMSASEKRTSDMEPRKSTRRLLQASFAIRRGFKLAGATFVFVIFLVALIGWPRGLIDQDVIRANLVSALFLTGLVLVVLEDHVGVNKAAVMLMVAAAMWMFLAVSYHPHQSEAGHEELQHELDHGLRDVGAIILFLLPAMGVVESIDHFDGFAVVTVAIAKLAKGRKEPLIPILGLLCFILSAVIDNLTATIVCLKLLRHAAGDDRHLRHSIGGVVVIAANAGGVWSPVGDVTTTMLWLADKITVTNTIVWLFLPSLVVIVFPLLGLMWEVRRGSRAAQSDNETPGTDDSEKEPALPTVTRGKVAVLVMGVVCILMVPVLKMATGLPPYLGMLMALGVIWFVTDTVMFQEFARIGPPTSPPESPRDEAPCDETPHTPRWAIVQEPSHSGSVVQVLHSLDLTGLLFFAGVLLAVSALDTAGVLRSYARWLVRLSGNSPVVICSLLGVSSAVVDNVPLVQAAINMFGASTPTDDPLWQLVALAAGTGGSILSIGSIAGVTLMTMEGVGYVWYCRKVSFWAALGFALGIATYQLERALFA